MFKFSKRGRLCFMPKKIFLPFLIVTIIFSAFQINFAAGTTKSLYFMIGSSQLRICDLGQCSFKKMDAKPELVYSRSFVPLRVIAEEMGFSIAWNPSNDEISLKKGSKNLKIFIATRKFISNNQVKYFDTPPYIKNDRTLVPLRFISEEFGYFVDWNFMEDDLKEIRLSNEKIPYEPW